MECLTGGNTHVVGCLDQLIHMLVAFCFGFFFSMMMLKTGGKAFEFCTCA